MFFLTQLLTHAKLYMPIFFLQGPKKLLGYTIVATNLLMAIVYANILCNIGEEFFVYANNKVLASTIGVDNLSMPIADINNGIVPRKFFPRVMLTITKTN